jgi:hypothetical protein
MLPWWPSFSVTHSATHWGHSFAAEAACTLHSPKAAWFLLKETLSSRELLTGSCWQFTAASCIFVIFLRAGHLWFSWHQLSFAAKFTYEIRHIASPNNKVVDTLSKIVARTAAGVPSGGPWAGLTPVVTDMKLHLHSSATPVGSGEQLIILPAALTLYWTGIWQQLRAASLTVHILYPPRYFICQHKRLAHNVDLSSCVMQPVIAGPYLTLFVLTPIWEFRPPGGSLPASSCCQIWLRWLMGAPLARRAREPR